MLDDKGAKTKLSLKNTLWNKLDNSKLPNANEFEEHVSQWADLLNQPIPKIKRISLDIEVESEIGRIPDPKLAEKKITAVGFEASDGFL